MKTLFEVKDADGSRSVEPWNGEVWVVHDQNSGDMEMFDERPHTVGVGGDPENWPSQYEVRVGHLGGGDSLRVEERTMVGEVWVLVDDEMYWTMVRRIA